MTRKTDRLEKVIQLTDEIKASRAKTSALARARRSALLRASREGATYKNLANLTGLCEAMIAKEIARAREETTNPVLAEAVPRNRATVPA